MLGVSCSWNDEASRAIQSGWRSRSATSASGVPMLPAATASYPSPSSSFWAIAVVVVLPFVPVIAT
jgi:hypothetical protein